MLIIQEVEDFVESLNSESNLSLPENSEVENILKKEGNSFLKLFQIFVNFNNLIKLCLRFISI